MTIHAMEDADRSAHQSFDDQISHLHQDCEQESQILTQKLEKAAETNQRLEDETCSLYQMCKDQTISRLAKEQEVAMLQEKLAQAEATVAKKT